MLKTLLIFSLIKTTIQEEEYDKSYNNLDKVVKITYNSAKVTDRNDSMQPMIKVLPNFTFRTCESQMLDRKAFIGQFLLNPHESMIAREFRDINYNYENGRHFIEFIATFEHFAAKFLIDCEGDGYTSRFIRGFAVYCPYKIKDYQGNLFGLG
ncbi:unnamed protein product [Caenorhabditis angaria]|uniref:Uncharacterized protein n=1 Tax=Caenorhabditis angaria TaxID=860376 RepID=A0A9P1N3P1_9PELO|nr:unnamed protein product [Caenorhabditis angaria]